MPSLFHLATAAQVDRRKFLATAARSTAAFGALSTAIPSIGRAAADSLPADTRKPPVIDTHMHVWANDARRYPFPHPYVEDFKLPPHEATLEMLIEDMNEHGCTHSVLVQVIYHGWDNTYIADCAKQYPKRLKAHGLVDPTDPKVADKLEFWVKEHGLCGMRFSPRYYQDGQYGGDGWLDADITHRLWRKAAELEAVLNFFVAPKQLPRLQKMIEAHPKVRVVIDHFGQLSLGDKDPEPEIRLLLALARCPNVWVKVSELTSVSKSGKYPFADAYPFVRRVYEAFGPDRLLFGTGYPGRARVGYGRPTLDQEIDLVHKKIPFFTQEDREKILGQNAMRLWEFES